MDSTPSNQNCRRNDELDQPDIREKIATLGSQLLDFVRSRIGSENAEAESQDSGENR